ncbi:PilZ domain-containing protein [Solibacillus sp. FSL H8-0538]|uniref:PilZ domain-containing protein n=1 Tax=Solibacillus sp. FSL H8-0538 TaxID=2921400 RepID=UPI0030FA77BF
MLFKRKEGFRFAFGEPVPANFVILVNGKPVDIEQSINPCQILDISPRGIKMFTEVDIGEHMNKLLQLEVIFVLDVTTIRAVGEIVWSRPYGRGKHYGLIFDNQPLIEGLIISELKMRRKKEIKRGKVGK